MKTAAFIVEPARLAGMALLAVSLCAPAVADVRVDTDNLSLRFAGNGDLLEARACLPRCSSPRGHVLDVEGEAPVLSFTSFASEPFDLVRDEHEDAVVLQFENRANRSLRRWRIPRQGFRLDLDVAGAERLDLATGTSLEPPTAHGFAALLERQRFVRFEDGDVEALELDEEAAPWKSGSWNGVRNRFWAVLARPGVEVEWGVAEREAPGSPGLVVQGTGRRPLGLSLYIGPVEPDALRSAAPELPDLMYSGLWFWLRWICQVLFWLMGAIHALVPDWAAAIMLLSLAVGILMRPLSRIADRLQDDVHRIEARLSPQIAHIRREHRGEEQSKKVLELYAAEGVHPLYSLKSLAGVAVVIPVFIGAFDMLAENIWLAGESFLWIADLSRPDAVANLPFSLPFFGDRLNLLPFVMTALSILASLLHRHDAMDEAHFRKHLRNLTLMAIAFLALFYTFPAGMVLYWTTNNLISVVRYGTRRLRRARQA